MKLLKRPRRLRRLHTIRAMVQETVLDASDLVMPIFVSYQPGKKVIDSLPGLFSYGLDSLILHIETLVLAGIQSGLLFPIVAPDQKSELAESAYDEDGLLAQAIYLIKQKFPDFIVMADVALDPFSTHGHDGLVAGGEVLNDETVAVLVKQALVYAQSGADVVAPSDMMDGRVGCIRAALDGAGFEQVMILSYAAKYASSFFGPFRGVLGSSPSFGDKKSYQMDPANRKEASLEAELDFAEGADILMVKPAGYYLDIICDFKKRFLCPIAAYHVSGEYVMIKLASEQGFLDEKKVFLEALTGIKRAGADIIVTYAALMVANWLRGDV